MGFEIETRIRIEIRNRKGRAKMKLRWCKNGGIGSFSVWVGKASTTQEINQLKIDFEEELETFYPGGQWHIRA